MNYGLTANGFVTKRLSTIKAEWEDEFRAAFGDIDTDPSSVFGQIIGIGSGREATLWELMELIYQSQSPSSAEAQQLDDASGYTGIERLPATKSRVTVVMYTEAITSLPVTIPALTEVSVRSAGDVCLLDENTDIDSNVVLDATVEIVTATSGVEYKVTINGTDFTYTATGGDDTAAIALQLVTSINGGSEPVTATDNEDGSFRLTADKVDNIRSTYTLVVTTDGTGTEIEITELGSPGSFTADIAGETPIPVGTMTEIDTPVSNLDRTDNLDAGSTGSEIETDAELRLRRTQSLQVAGAATLAAIRSKLLNDVDDVIAVSIWENATEVDYTPTGLPPHSFECVVTGGDDQEIGQMIWDTKPAGIQTHGDVEIEVTDTNGDTQKVYFSRPTDKYAWVKVRYSVYSEENYPGDAQAIQAIKDSLLEFGNDFEIGEDMIRDRFYGPCFAVEGIGTIDTLEIALTDTEGGPPSYGTSNIPVAVDEIARFAEARLDVDKTP